MWEEAEAYQRLPGGIPRRLARRSARASLPCINYGFWLSPGFGAAFPEIMSSATVCSLGTESEEALSREAIEKGRLSVKDRGVGAEIAGEGWGGEEAPPKGD